MQLLFVILSALDVLLTSLVLNQYGSAMEMNPIAAMIYDHFGVPGLIALKVVSVGSALFLCRFVPPRERRWLMLFACLVTSVVVVMGVMAYAS